MASYTTPRTANVGDTWTAAWYNGEVRDDIKWAHDTLLSVGSTFPASPATGQRHLFASGTTRLIFAWDGTNWISEELGLVPLMLAAQYNAAAVAAQVACVAAAEVGFANATPVTLRPYLANVPALEVADTVKNASMTLQGRLEGYAPRTAGSAAGKLSVGVATASAIPGTLGSDANITGSETDLANGSFSGAWADLASGSVALVQFLLYGRLVSGTTTSWRFESTTLRLRFKK